MKCGNHPEHEGVLCCNHCGESFCPECVVAAGSENYCRECVRRVMAREPARVSPLLAAVLSFIFPGLGQVYNGQMGKGITVFMTCWLLVPWVCGIVDAYRTGKRIASGELVATTRFGCLLAFVVGAWVGLVALVAGGILAAVLVAHFMDARVKQNEAKAQAHLKTVSTALEKYAVDNSGAYPLEERSLGGYLDISYKSRIIDGYAFSEALEASGYTVTARPVECDKTGGKVFYIRAGGVLSEEPCRQQGRQDEEVRQK